MTADAAPAEAQGGVLRLLRSDAVAIVLLFVVSRLGILLVGYLTLRLIPSRFADANLLPDLFVRWDADWYVDIARSGYDTSEHVLQPGATSFAFYPIYPLLMRGLGDLTGMSLASAGVLISNVCFLAALFAINAFGRTVGSRAEALMSVALICFVPQGLVFSAVYTESLFLLLTASSMLAYSRQRYWTAGVLSAVNSAVRSNGVLIVVWYGLEIIRKRGFKAAFRFWESPADYLPLVAAPFGLIAWWWFSYIMTGDAFAQKSTMAHGWGWAGALPWNSIMVPLLQGTIEDRFWVISMLVALVSSLLLLRRGQWTLFVYVLANLLLYLNGNLSNSLLRYAISIFPLYYGASYYLTRSSVLTGAVFGALSLLGGFLVAAWALRLNITI